MDLDEFDPNQFDISFSSSSEVSVAASTRTKDEHREDKKLVDQLNGITALMKRIDNQLANKDRLLNSAANTPMKMNNLPLQFSQSKTPNKYGSPEDGKDSRRVDNPKNIGPFDPALHPDDQGRPKNRPDGSRDPKDRSRRDEDDPRNRDDMPDPRKARDNSRDAKNRRDRSDDEDPPRQRHRTDPDDPNSRSQKRRSEEPEDPSDSRPRKSRLDGDDPDTRYKGDHQGRPKLDYKERGEDDFKLPERRRDDPRRRNDDIDFDDYKNDPRSSSKEPRTKYPDDDREARNSSNPKKPDGSKNPIDPRKQDDPMHPSDIKFPDTSKNNKDPKNSDLNRSASGDKKPIDDRGKPSSSNKFNPPNREGSSKTNEGPSRPRDSTEKVDPKRPSNSRERKSRYQDAEEDDGDYDPSRPARSRLDGDDPDTRYKGDHQGRPKLDYKERGEDDFKRPDRIRDDTRRTPGREDPSASHPRNQRDPRNTRDQSPEGSRIKPSHFYDPDESEVIERNQTPSPRAGDKYESSPSVTDPRMQPRFDNNKYPPTKDDPEEDPFSGFDSRKEDQDWMKKDPLKPGQPTRVQGGVAADDEHVQIGKKKPQNPARNSNFSQRDPKDNAPPFSHKEEGSDTPRDPSRHSQDTPRDLAAKDKPRPDFESRISHNNPTDRSSDKDPGNNYSRKESSDPRQSLSKEGRKKDPHEAVSRDSSTEKQNNSRQIDPRKSMQQDPKRDPDLAEDRRKDRRLSDQPQPQGNRKSKFTIDDDEILEDDNDKRKSNEPAARDSASRSNTRDKDDRDSRKSRDELTKRADEQKALQKDSSKDSRGKTDSDKQADRSEDQNRDKSFKRDKSIHNSIKPEDDQQADKRDASRKSQRSDNRDSRDDLRDPKKNSKLDENRYESSIEREQDPKQSHGIENEEDYRDNRSTHRYSRVTDARSSKVNEQGPGSLHRTEAADEYKEERTASVRRKEANDFKEGGGGLESYEENRISKKKDRAYKPNDKFGARDNQSKDSRIDEDGRSIRSKSRDLSEEKKPDNLRDSHESIQSSDIKERKNSKLEEPAGKKGSTMYAENLLIPDKRKSNRDIQSTTNPDTVIIPILTYPKLKNFKKKSDEVGDILIDEEDRLQNADSEKDRQKKENIGELLELAGAILNDLDKHNKRNSFVNNLKADYRELEDDKGLLEEDSDPAFAKKLSDFLDSMNKLEVQEKEFLDSREEDKLKHLQKRKSFQKILTEQEAVRPSFSTEEIMKGNVTRPELKEMVLKFLTDYGKRVRSLKTPSSEVLAKEVEEAIELVKAVDQGRPPTQSLGLLKMLSQAIHSNFDPKPEDEEGSVPPTIEGENQENKIIEFNDLLRALSKLSDIKFIALDDMVTEPSNKVNLFTLRHDQIVQNKVDPKRDKENDLLVLSSVVDDKPKLEQLIIKLGRELLPPRTYVNKGPASMEDSGDFVSIKFVDIRKNDETPNKPAYNRIISDVEKKQDKEPFLSDFDDKGFNFVPTKPATSERKYNNQPTIPRENIHDLKPNPINSDEEEYVPMQRNHDDSFQNRYHQLPSSPHATRQETDPEKKSKVDMKEGLADKLEIMMDDMADDRAQLTILKNAFDKSNDSKKPVKTQTLIPPLQDLAHILSNVVEYEKANAECKPEFEKLKSVDPPLPSKGLLKVFPRFANSLNKMRQAAGDAVKTIKDNKHISHPSHQSLKGPLQRVDTAIKKSEEAENPKKAADELSAKVDRLADTINELQEAHEAQDAHAVDPMSDEGYDREETGTFQHKDRESLQEDSAQKDKGAASDLEHVRRDKKKDVPAKPDPKSREEHYSEDESAAEHRSQPGPAKRGPTIQEDLTETPEERRANRGEKEAARDSQHNSKLEDKPGKKHADSRNPDSRPKSHPDDPRSNDTRKPAAGDTSKSKLDDLSSNDAKRPASNNSAKTKPDDPKDPRRSRNQDPENPDPRKSATQDGRTKPAEAPQRNDAKKASRLEDGEAAAKSLVPGVGAAEDYREEEVVKFVAEAKLAKSQKQLLGLLKSMQFALENSENLSRVISAPDRKLTPVEAKTESVLSQSHYEFARNNLLNNLHQPATVIMLAQRSELPPLSKNVQASADKVYNPVKDNAERDQLMVDCLRLHDELAKIEWDDGEAEAVRELEEKRKEEARESLGIAASQLRQAESAGSKDPRKDPKLRFQSMVEDPAQKREQRDAEARQKAQTIEQVVQQLREDLQELKPKVAGLEEVSPEQKQRLRDKIEQSQALLESRPIPPAETIAEISELVHQVHKTLPKVEPESAEARMSTFAYANKPSEDAAVLAAGIDDKANRLADLLTDLHKQNMLRAAEALHQEADKRDIDLTKPPEHPRNADQARSVTPADKQQLHEKLEELKRTIAECMECAEER